MEWYFDLYNQIFNYFTTNTELMPLFMTSIVYLMNTYKNIYKLSVVPLVKKVKRVKLPPELKENNKELSEEELISKKFCEDLLVFYKRMHDKLEKENLITLNNNIRKIKTNRSISDINSKFKSIGLDFEKMLGCFAGGAYIPQFNKLLVFSDSYRLIIFHELMHMSSSVKKNGLIYNGLQQSIGNSTIGRGINEGVTQLLTERYFEEYLDNDKYEAYPYEVSVAKALEMIIGEDIVRNSYFRNDLSGLMKNLSKYAPENKVKEFIINMDLVNESILIRDPLVRSQKLHAMKKAIDSINTFLMECYKTKLALLDDKDKEKNMEEFINLLNKENYYKMIKYDFSKFQILSANDEKEVGPVK